MASTLGPRHGAASLMATSASTTLFRRLTWEGTVPLEIRVDSKELPANSNRGLECYFIQAARVSYLPLLVPDVKKFLVDVVLDEEGAKILKEEDWWFEAEDGSPLKWHWPIGLLYDSHTIAATIRPNHTTDPIPLKLVLHLALPPTDKLLLVPSAEACKQAFMGQLKEADFIRWGSTKRMTSLRKAEQDGIWEGIKEHNFDDYWRVASKVTPTTIPARSQSPPPGPGSLHTRPPSVDPGTTTTAPDKDGASSVRSVPVRIYLPDGPVLQELAPPLLDGERPHTVSRFLTSTLPLLFPETGKRHAYALVQGVVCPPETELSWLGACMAGADGWVNICIGISSG
ncbi:autophagy protein Apg5-domain-containing protein [Thelephora terrestris]|uniref:Autophagy protein 5 n=1 Tax=Thelephora terrestris TaxID=56493 RepID=A0A9P6L8Z1_9AGAM|nr:autophagy protein Apg5-domain-containing protein [Thelephora terrestris]